MVFVLLIERKITPPSANQPIQMVINNRENVYGVILYYELIILNIICHFIKNQTQ